MLPHGGTPGFTTTRLYGGHKSHVTKILGQSAEFLAYLSYEHIVQLMQEIIQWEEKLATIKILDNQILDLL